MKTQKLITGLLVLQVISCIRHDQKVQTTIKENESPNYSGPIIDMHCHAFDQIFFGGNDYLNPLTGKTYKASSTVDSLRIETLAKYEEHNVVKAMVSDGELWFDYAPEKIIIGNDHHNSIDELRQRFKSGKLKVIGEVAPNYDGILPTGESLNKYFDLAVELDIPIGYHLFPGGPPGGAYFAYPKTRAFQGKPLQFEEILFNRPNIKIYIMHAAWPYLEDLKALMYAHPQVYVGLGVIDWVLPRKEFHHFLKGLVDAGFGERIMFGTDQMIWVETIDDAIEAVNSADFLTLKQKEDIFYNNAAKFLGFTEEEIKTHKSQ
ncbi:amidohydrolase family protein [Aegicerativicinus sediminis]|uniref:amidohydrolase family protein n=1 Tax=Aegicerativicinus sediminis TaxID=2893202 RepID=UPI001E34AC68|nr:amidohydrolase family protein [Aegicerativicinus sediminis]